MVDLIKGIPFQFNKNGPEVKIRGVIFGRNRNVRIRGVIFSTKIKMKGYNKMGSALRDPRPETRLPVYRPSYIRDRMQLVSLQWGETTINDLDQNDLVEQNTLAQE